MSLARTLAVVSLVLLTPTARAEKAAEDVQDLIAFHDARPLFLRLHIAVDGQPYRAHWAATIVKLHKYLDTDGDGVFSAEERVRWLKQFGGIMQMSRPRIPGAPNARMISEVSTAADLADYLRASFGPFQLQVVAANTDANDPLFRRLDLDGNGTLSRSERTAAESTLMKFDQDDDETVRADELNPYQNPYMARRRQVRGAQTPSAPAPEPLFVAIGADEPLAKLARRLLAKYDTKGTPDDGPGPDNRLQAVEIGLDPASFATIDQDGDGGLDLDEVTRALANLPIDLELRVSMGRKGLGVGVVTPADRPPNPAVRKGPGGEVLLDIDPDLIEIHAPAGGGVDLRDFYRQQFRAADGDNNKYLEMKEAQANGIFNKNVFALMDRDGDGKLFENEMDEFVGHQVDAAESRTVLSVSDRGRTLFPVLDSNGDGRLSVRELRRAAEQLRLCDRNGDGDVVESEIPRHHRLDFVPGQSPALIQFGVQTSAVVAGTTTPTAGADWFRRMDLNLDGDVSPREFLGTRDQFRRVDTDGDGLIDAREAARAR